MSTPRVKTRFCHNDPLFEKSNGFERRHGTTNAAPLHGLAESRLLLEAGARPCDEGLVFDPLENTQYSVVLSGEDGARVDVRLLERNFA